MKYVKALIRLCIDYAKALARMYDRVLAGLWKFVPALFIAVGVTLFLPQAAVGLATMTFVEPADTHIGMAAAGILGVAVAGLAGLFMAELLAMLAAIGIVITAEEFVSTVRRRLDEETEEISELEAAGC